MKNIFAATATYGRGFKPTQVADQYSVRIYVGGFAGPGTADEKVGKEIDAFLKKEGFTTYQIIKRRPNFIPSYYEYTVQFGRKEA